MKKTTLLLALLGLAASQGHAQDLLTLDEARQVAERYYSSLNLILQDPRGDGSIDGQRQAYSAVGNDRNGLPIGGEIAVPDDLATLTGRQPSASIRLGNYIVALRDLAAGNGMKLHYKILRCEYLQGPEMKKHEATPPFVRVLVEKQFVAPTLRSPLLRDTLSLDTRTHGITQLTNVCRQRQASSPTLSSISDMLATAANLYADKRYDEAFALYDRVLQRDPTNSDASFNLGTMCFKGQGCQLYPRKVRDYMAEFYWQKSNRGLDHLAEYVYNSPRRIIHKSYSGLEKRPFVSNRMLIIDTQKGLCGYMSPNGETPIKQVYSFAYPFFENGTALVRTKNQTWMLIDTMGEPKTILNKGGEVQDGKYHFIIPNQLDKDGIFDRYTGQCISPYEYKVLHMHEGPGHGSPLTNYAWFIVAKDEGIGLYVRDHGIVLPCRFHNIRLYTQTVTTSDYYQFVVDYDVEKAKALIEKHKRWERIPGEELAKIGTIIGLDFQENDRVICFAFVNNKMEWFHIEQ